MSHVLIPIADGTEEIEAVTLIDVLRRAEVEVCVASVMPGRTQVTASRGVGLVADTTIDACLNRQWDLIALPGGMPGAEHLQQCAALQTLLREQHQAERALAAICAAPAVVLGALGMLEGVKATGYPAFQGQMAEQGAQLQTDPVVVHGHLITSQGPGTSMALALQLVYRLCGATKAEAVAKGLLVRWTPA